MIKIENEETKKHLFVRGTETGRKSRIKDHFFPASCVVKMNFISDTLYDHFRYILTPTY